MMNMNWMRTYLFCHMYCSLKIVLLFSAGVKFQIKKQKQKIIYSLMLVYDIQDYGNFIVHYETLIEIYGLLVLALFKA